ncbi:gonadotropin-releasing hormone receptor [Caerostris darwini]|uniref:Gonadotropin-releasing hormone receptor n=1 Tax=Caerostris darwini TaxID=1538125 RepID=A0AAV4U1R6_9ARAC|nr:gonadotropin-releasing hormone receptor [Caerostris darwini]
MNESCTEMKTWNSDDNNVKSYIKVNNCTHSESFDNPDHLTFNGVFTTKNILCSLVVLFAVCDNLLVLVTLDRNQLKKSRVCRMMMRPIMSDVIMIFVAIPLETAWRISGQWKAGDAACKTMLYLRTFGPYLSSTAVAGIGLDKYFAIVHPLRFIHGHERSKKLLGAAWAISLVCSIPQSIIYHVENHPEFPQFTQCVNHNFFPTPYHELAYDMFCLVIVYGAPLSIILFCNVRILWVICKRYRALKAALTQEYGKCPCHRRGDIAHITRDLSRVYRMMITTSLTFVLFLIPYAATVVWRLSRPASAENMESSMQSFFLAFSVSSSCVNPFINGSYAFTFRKRVMKFGWGKTAPKTAPANRFSEISHLRVSATPTITCPVPLNQWSTCHCSSSCSKIEDNEDEISTPPPDEEEFTPVTSPELEAILNNIKPRKVKGLDGIFGELVKELYYTKPSWFRNLINTQ